jgi:dihydroorotate dehydrogenase (fumarate)
MRQHLLPTIDVIGAGGIESGTDVFLFLLCGATAVQVGTCHWKEGPKCFDRICDELRELLKEKGYSSVQEVIGKLKPWSKEGAALTRAAKKKEEATNTTKTASGEPQGMDVSKMLNAVLMLVIAILLADKFGALLVPE